MLLDEQNDIKRTLTTIGLPIILLIILFIMVIYKLYGIEESELYEKTKTNDTYLMVYVTKECDTCQDVEKRLRDNDIRFYELNLNKEKRTTEILTKFKIDREELKAPALIYIKDGKLLSYVNDIKDVETFNSFIKEYLR